MKALLGALAAACVLTASSAAVAASTWWPAATFYSVGDGPLLQYDATPLPNQKVGGVSVDTLTLPGETNIMFQFHRDGLPPLAEYDFLADLEAWGELPAILLIDANIGGPMSSSLGAGPFSIVYNGVTDLVAGGKTYKTGARLLYGTIIFDDWNVWGYTSSDVGCCGIGGLPKQFSLDLTDVVQSGHITRANLQRGAFYATVPEPATWAMLIIGFGLSGMALRNNRRPTFA